MGTGAHDGTLMNLYAILHGYAEPPSSNDTCKAGNGLPQQVFTHWDIKRTRGATPRRCATDSRDLHRRHHKPDSSSRESHDVVSFWRAAAQPEIEERKQNGSATVDALPRKYPDRPGSGNERGRWGGRA